LQKKTCKKEMAHYLLNDCCVLCLETNESIGMWLLADLVLQGDHLNWWGISWRATTKSQRIVRAPWKWKLHAQWRQSMMLLQ
jgi:hypothetical protein